MIAPISFYLFPLFILSVYIYFPEALPYFTHSKIVKVNNPSCFFNMNIYGKVCTRVFFFQTFALSFKICAHYQHFTWNLLLFITRSHASHLHRQYRNRKSVKGVVCVESLLLRLDGPVGKQVIWHGRNRSY